MKLSVALKLGRVSNLPTVWSNVLTGMALAGTAAVDCRPKMGWLSNLRCL